ncbi:atherin-like [Mesocricetus auratus]|uniref:Atherin-like n=1 Tax=Mesocricetus auratus TaxID=10036 RepID=A0ABM2X8H4_MESAU|nr:atherin-like [Mesocricetus auratus]
MRKVERVGPALEIFLGPLRKVGREIAPQSWCTSRRGGGGGEGGRKVRGEGRNVSRPVEFSAARPLLADKAGRAGEVWAAACEPRIHPASPQPAAARPEPAARIPSPPREKRLSGRPPRTAKTRAACGNSHTKKGRPIPAGRPGRARLHRGAADGGAGRGSAGAVTAEVLSSPSPCPRQPPPPTPGLTKVCQVPPPGQPSPWGSAGARRPAPAHLGARPLARGSHRSKINKSACGRGREARVSRRRKSTVAPTPSWGRGSPRRAESRPLPADRPCPAPLPSPARAPRPGRRAAGLRRLVPPT